MFIMGDKPVNKILQNMKTSPSVIDYLLKDWNDIEVLPIITREEFIVLLEGSAQLFSDTLTTEDDDIDKYIYEITVDKHNIIIELEYQFIKHKRSTFFCLYQKRADYVKNNNINYWTKFCMIDLGIDNDNT